MARWGTRSQELTRHELRYIVFGCMDLTECVLTSYILRHERIKSCRCPTSYRLDLQRSHLPRLSTHMAHLRQSCPYQRISKELLAQEWEFCCLLAITSNWLLWVERRKAVAYVYTMIGFFDKMVSHHFEQLRSYQLANVDNAMKLSAPSPCCVIHEESSPIWQS